MFFKRLATKESSLSYSFGWMESGGDAANFQREPSEQ